MQRAGRTVTRLTSSLTSAVRGWKLVLPQHQGGAKGRPPVSTPIAEPTTRVVWCLRRRRADVRCLLRAEALPVEVQILQDRDLVLTEVFPEEGLALNWARAYGDRLKLQGWRDTDSIDSGANASS